MAAQRPAGQAWFRLPTMRPPAAAAAPPAPVVRPAIPTRPPPPPSDQPQVPAAAAAPPPPAARPRSPPPAATPPPPPPPTTISTSNDTRSATPVSSPKIVKPSSHPHPPSPLQLPPAPEEPIEKQPLKINNSSKGKRETPTREKKKKVSDSEDLGVTVITIAGENRGALMEIRSSSFKKSGKINGETAKKANESGEEGKGDCDDESPAPSQATATFLNNNVQGVNSSIVYNSSCSHNDPGIHLSLTRNPKLSGKNNINGKKNHQIN